MAKQHGKSLARPIELARDAKPGDAMHNVVCLALATMGVALLCLALLDYLVHPRVLRLNLP